MGDNFFLQEHVKIFDTSGQRRPASPLRICDLAVGILLIKTLQPAIIEVWNRQGIFQTRLVVPVINALVRKSTNWNRELKR